ncbi:MAG TPA: hypothetical protein VMC41_03305 [Candidatus Nanoarchaeia archaeon]|nr:hypothetical protein [Candidatus Nanoarchaeia archaeon]
MALLPFLQKPKRVEDQNDAAERKIEFAQKLPSGEIEGEAAPKAGNFDFLKSFSERQPGEKVPVKITPAPMLAEEKATKTAAPDKPKRGLLSDFLSFGRRADGDKNRSRVLEVNLVKGEIVKFFDWQGGVLILLMAVFIAMAVLSGIYWGISIWGAGNNKAGNSDYLQQYYKISKEINDLGPQVDQVMAFKNKLDQVNFLLDRHIYWTNFFSFLEDNTLSDVYFSGFNGTVNGSYSLSATTDSLDAIDAQIKKLLANPYIKNAEVDSGSISGAQGKPSVGFSLSFTLDPKIFLK